MTPPEPRTGIGTLVHLILWIALFTGLWFHWPYAMLIGFSLSVANITGLGLPVGITLIATLLLLPFPPLTTAGLNLRLFLLCALVLQVWQFCLWIQGAAAH